MAADTKSISTESISSEEDMEVRNMDAVSLEDEVDVEQQKPRQSGAKAANDSWAKTTSTRRRNAALGIVLLLCVVVAISATLSVKLGKSGNDVVRTESSSVTAQDALPAEAAPAPAPAESSPTEEGGSVTTPSDTSLKQVTLRGFSSDITQGYASVEEFEADLTKTAEYVAYNIIQWNIHHNSRQGDDQGDDMMAMTGVALDAGASASTASALEKQAQSAKRARSKTNNQEKDADESDIVKSDEQFVYAAHSTYMLVWDRHGNIINRINTTTALTEWGYYDSHTIRGILLTDEHVVLVTESYDGYSEETFGLYDRNSTHVEVYTKPTETNLDMELVGSKSFNGYYHDGRWMQDSNSIQILTGGSIKSWSFPDELSPTNFPWLSKEDYAKKAAEKASNQLIPDFVRAVSRDLMVDGQLPNMLRLNAWTVEDQKEGWKKFGQYAIDQVMNSYTQITSFSVSDFGVDEELAASASVLFAPTNYPTLYGTDDKLVVALSKSEWDEETQHNRETTFLMNLNVVSTSKSTRTATEFQSVTMLDGRLQSRYALDIQGNNLRVATTIQKWFPLDNVWAACGDGYNMFDSCMTETIYDECTQVAPNCPKDKVVKTGCPYTFTCESNETNAEDISSTDNYIYVFDIEQKGEIKELGRVRIGKQHEIITSVRFGETFSYATTFDQRDPFYVLMLEPGQAPAISGSVTLEGFPSYLHPLNEQQTMLVGIGQNTTGTGLNQVNSGVMISVFDVSDPTDPEVVDSHMLARDASSPAEWDYKAVAYDNGKLIIPATIYENTFWDDDVDSMNAPPMPEMEYSYSEGFVVLNVNNPEGIQELFRVNHAKGDGECRYCSSYHFSEFRSFTYDDGSLMTIHDNVVISTNLTSGEEIWRLEPHDEGETTKDCCW